MRAAIGRDGGEDGKYHFERDEQGRIGRGGDCEYVCWDWDGYGGLGCWRMRSSSMFVKDLRIDDIGKGCLGGAAES